MAALPRIEATTSFAALTRCVAVLICVPTPLSPNREHHDPHVPALGEGGLRSMPLDDALDGVDLALIVTAHPGVDHIAAVSRVPLALDLRGVTRGSGGGAVLL